MLGSFPRFWSTPNGCSLWTRTPSRRHNVLRPDVVQPSLPRDEALANAADTAENQFRVAAVLDTD